MIECDSEHLGCLHDYLNFQYNYWLPTLNADKAKKFLPKQCSRDQRCGAVTKIENDVTMKTALPGGTYPFIDKRYPLSELAMIEAPAELETLLRSQAAANGIEIARGIPIEL